MTRRAVGYSRYSSDLQNERSIEDQEALIRRHAGLNSLDLVRLYSDAAQSGASILGRDGLLRLLDDARAGQFEVVVVEELDRLSRDMEDLAGIHKRLTFAGVEILAVHEGVASTVTVGLRGLVGQLFREDNARKIRRGLAGKVRQGLSAGGRAYGYDLDPARPGVRSILPDEAAVILRVFTEFAAGASPIEIAKSLNRDRIPPPHGAAWTASTIYGWEERRSGILRNDLYGGEIVWNKTRMVKDPSTGRRVPRTNPAADWQRQAAPELRIVPQGLWQQVQAMIRPRPRTKSDIARMKRPTRPLSGLLRCGACGAGLAVKGTDKSGRVRVACSRHEQSRSCPDPHTYYLDRIEGAVFAALRDEIDNPRHLALYVETYNAARRELVAGEARRRADLERQVARLDAEVDRLIDFVARGIGNTDRLATDYAERCEELAEAQRQLALTPAPLTDVALHPRALEGYRKALENLAPLIAADHIATGNAHAAALRELITSVTVSPGGAPGHVNVRIEGSLRRLIAAPAISADRVRGALVAREGSGRLPHPEPLFVLFRAA